MAIQSQYFPKSERMPDHLKDLIDIFREKDALISSSANQLKSDEVLAVLAPEMEERGYLVEKKGKLSTSSTSAPSAASAPFKIRIPVLYGRNNTIAKAFEVDGFHKATGTVVEIEAGRAVVNHQFLKDLFEAIAMQEINYLVIAVRNIYSYGNTQSKDFEKVEEFIDVLYTSNRINLPLKGILIIGY